MQLSVLQPCEEPQVELLSATMSFFIGPLGVALILGILHLFTESKYVPGDKYHFIKCCVFTGEMSCAALCGFVCTMISNVLPGALVETSKHQQLFLAEDHAVAAATRRTARRPEKKKRTRVKSFWIAHVGNVNQPQQRVHDRDF